MSHDPAAQSVGQITADGQFRWDGQQWVPLPADYRERTPWTRPMQLAAAALFATSAVVSVIIAVLFINHDTMLKVLKAQGTQIPSGTDMDTVVTASIAFAYGIVIFFAVLDIVAAIGSYLGWRWMFWAALVLCGLTGLQAFTNLSTFGNPDRSFVPIGGVVVTELLSILALALFVWMLIGVIRYGPWAMKKPGRP